MKLNNIAISIVFISTASVACEADYPKTKCPVINTNTVNLFEKDYGLSYGINQLHTITIDEATGIFIIDNGINLNGIKASADTFKIINDRALLINKSNKLNPAL